MCVSVCVCARARMMYLHLYESILLEMVVVSDSVRVGRGVVTVIEWQYRSTVFPACSTHALVASVSALLHLIMHVQYSKS